jgi:hypothetical protein
MDDPRMADRWWDYNPSNDTAKDIPGAPEDYFGWSGVPCDADDQLDAYDWNRDGQFTEEDHNASVAYLQKYDPDLDGSPYKPSLSPLSTCIGCGIRASLKVLEDARPGSVWVVVLLTDGYANLSDTAGSGGYGMGDTPNTGGLIPLEYPGGFCNGELNGGWWPQLCRDASFSPRYCVDDDEATCPPNTTWEGEDPSHYYNYSVMDYARDMADDLALTKSLNMDESRGNDVAVYSIGLGAVSLGEPLLRYIASVGDDGDRTTDPCRTTPGFRSCGQYYYTSESSQLVEIFEDIASRIYTRITQ